MSKSNILTMWKITHCWLTFFEPMLALWVIFSWLTVHMSSFLMYGIVKASLSLFMVLVSFCLGHRFWNFWWKEIVSVLFTVRLQLALLFCRYIFSFPWSHIYVTKSSILLLSREKLCQCWGGDGVYPKGEWGPRYSENWSFE